jgi:nicotinic acid phosphoribosyltransferase
MAYAYWKSGKVADRAVFDLFFRKNPFHGEFTIFAGLEECVKFLDNFHYSDSGTSWICQGSGLRTEYLISIQVSYIHYSLSTVLIDD